jgi:putative transposase
VLELLKEAKTLLHLSTEHGVAPTVLREWKQAAITGLADVFEKRDSVTTLNVAHEQHLAELYAEIGRLTTHVNFLKKAIVLTTPERRALVWYDLVQSGNIVAYDRACQEWKES